MTQREFLNAIVNGTINDEVKTFAAETIVKLDEQLAKRKEKTSKKAQENQPLVDQIVDEILNTESKTASDVAVCLDITVQKASSLLRAAVAQGKAVQTEVKVPKKGIQKAYKLAE